MIGSVMAPASFERASPPCTARVLGPLFLGPSATSGLQELDLVGVALDRVGDRTQVGGGLDRSVGVARLDTLELAQVIGGLLLGELEAVRGRDHHDALLGPRQLAGNELT